MKKLGSEKLTKLVIGIIWALSLLMLVVFSVWIEHTSKSKPLDLRFHYFAIVSFLSFIVNLVAMFLIYKLRQRTDASKWACIFILGVVSWSACDVLAMLSNTSATANYWFHFETLGTVVVPVALF